jgi:hypothetical protein
MAASISVAIPGLLERRGEHVGVRIERPRIDEREPVSEPAGRAPPPRLSKGGGMAETETQSESRTTTDRQEIQRWAEERGGRPAGVKGTGEAGDPGVLRIMFDSGEENLEEISWEQFFEAFEQNNLAFLYQERTADGGVSRFHKFVSRDS